MVPYVPALEESRLATQNIGMLAVCYSTVMSTYNGCVKYATRMVRYFTLCASLGRSASHGQ